MLVSEMGAEINAQTHDGRSALHVAVRVGHVEVARVLTQLGGNVFLEDAEGNPPHAYTSGPNMKAILEPYIR